MTLIVQKYGGTSLTNARQINQAANRIARAKKSGIEVVVVVSAMGKTTDQLLKLASQVSDDPNTRELDILLSTGELVSSTLLAMALATQGHSAISLSGLQAGIWTDTTYGKARIARMDTSRVQEELKSGKVVIVAGFQGITEAMDVTTLGRGGSDVTAVALAAALEAQRCEIYTDVDGIYTADPSVVPEARKLDEIDYEEMLEMATYGAKMHPRSIDLGSVYNVLIYVASSFTNTPGTLIRRGVKKMEERIKVTGIAYDLNVAKLTLLGVPDRPGIAASLFEPLARGGISVDTIVQNTSQENLTDMSFTVARADLSPAVEVVKPLIKAIGAKELSTETALGKISIIGAGMQNAPGYAARMFRTLADNKINIEMITTSEIRITCIVQEAHVKEAVQVLHKAFQLDHQ